MKAVSSLRLIAVTALVLISSFGSAEGTGSIADLRQAISDRLAVMEDVALYKWHHQLPVEAPERETRVLAATLEKASAVGLDRETATRAIIAQMEAAKRVQRGFFERWAAEGPPDRTAPDLASDIRPKINGLTDGFLLALQAVQSDLGACAAQNALIAPGGITADIWALATHPLIPAGVCQD